MILKVSFHDNDFSAGIAKACEDILERIIGSNKFQDADNAYKAHKANRDLENIRLSIVMCSFGYYIADKGGDNLIFDEIEDLKFSLRSEERILEYLDRRIKLEEVGADEVVLDNSEICYIDFFSGLVYV